MTVKRLAERLATVMGLVLPMSAFASDDSVPRIAIDYDLSIAGISIGDASLLAEEKAASGYAAQFDMSFRFLFWSGAAAGYSVGHIVDGGRVPAKYDVTFEGMSKPVVIKTGFDSDGPVDWSITPPPEDKFLKERVPLAQADLRGAIDPLSAMLIQANSPDQACNRTLEIFTGGTRLDLVLRPGTATEPGVFACDVTYRPVSGHRADSESVARLVKNGPILSIFEVAPDLWAPHRVGIATSVGTLAVTRIPPERAD